MIQDIRYGARLLWRSPWFTLVAVVSLGVGLGSGLAIFTFTNAVLFRPLPGHGTADIQVIQTSNSDGRPGGATSYADFQSFLNASPSLFAGSCAAAKVNVNIVAGAVTRAVPGAVFSGGCFDLLKLKPHQDLGRLLNRSDDQPTGQDPAVVISYTLWQRAFAGDRGIVGRGIQLNGAPAVIVGVAERGFAGLSLDGGAEFWVPMPLVPVLLSPDTLTNRGSRRFVTLVRLAEGVSRSQVADQLSAMAEGLRAEDPVMWTTETGITRPVTIGPEVSSRFGFSGGASEIAAATLGAIAAIVAMACVNLATMIMARGAARTRELNVRLALGASRGRLLRQLATESLLISAGGVVLGLVGVAAALNAFEAYRPADIPAFNLALDWRVGIFSGFMAIAAPMLFGVAPGAHALRLAIAEGMKGRSLATRRRFLRIGPREMLLVVQVGASFALLIITVLFMRSLMPVEPGQTRSATGRIAVVTLDVNTAASSDAELQSVTRRLLEAAGRVPDVDGTTAAALIPMTGTIMTIAGRALDQAGSSSMTFDANIVAPGYFELTGIGRRAGRGFDVTDHERAPRVAVVSESLARRLWNTTEAVGRYIRMDSDRDRPREVVGVVADSPYRSANGTPQPVLYLPLAQSLRERFILHARVKNEREALLSLERALRAVDPRVFVGTPMPLDTYLDQARIEARVTQWIGGAAGLLQLGLALMALWGLVAYSVERRTAEFAIRRALGATDASIVQLVMRPSVRLAAAGAAFGVVAGAAIAKTLQSEFIGLAPIDLRVVAPAALVLGAVVVAAAWLPARRATSIEPASALKQV
jgi:macrolide transport system ATP-binding/permease protein